MILLLSYLIDILKYHQAEFKFSHYKFHFNGKLSQVQREGGATALIMAARAEVLLKLNRPMT